ncbi:MAG: alpha-amylase family glycosyl hydrolase [Victivallaceae bacterium]
MNSEQSGREWIKDAVLYQIYPQSYCDSNGDGIGDLPGIIAKLDYIAALGVNLLWLSPCFDSPFNDAGYDVRDFYKIAPRYGTNADMEQLCAEAHKRGLRVCLDLVAGHSSLDCEWFKQSSVSESGKYSKYYLWTNHWLKASQGHWIKGYAPRNGSFMINFFWSQPALNYGFANPDPDKPWEEPVDGEGPKAVIAELKNVMKFWLDIGCDGFRVDMASSLVKNDPGSKAVINLWHDNLQPWIRKNYPHAVTIAEWGNPADAVGKAGFDIDFMLHFGLPGYGEMLFKHPAVCGRSTDGICFFDEAGKGSPKLFIEEYTNAFKKTDGKGFISIPSANHDFQRLNYYRSDAEMKAAFAFILTWPGVPSIYYGDEIGMRFQPELPSKEGGYTRTGTRTPMQWNNQTNAGFSSASPEKIYLPVDSASDRPTVAAQDEKSDSLLNHVRKLLELRKNIPELRNEGKLKVLSDLDSYPLIYQRGGKNQNKYLIVINPSATPTETSLKLNISKAEPLLDSGAKINVRGKEAVIKLDGLSWGIFKLKKT